MTRSTLTRRGLLAGPLALALPVAAGAQTPAQPQPGAEPSDPRLILDGLTILTAREPFRSQVIKPRLPGRRPAIVLVHERGGPGAAYRALGRRLALEGFVVVLPDLMSPYGLTPEAPGEGKDAFSRQPITELSGFLGVLLDSVPRIPECNGAIGSISFQWGTNVVWPALADPKRLRAAVLFDPLVDKPEKWQSVAIPVQTHVAELDQVISGQMEAAEKRLLVSARAYEQYVYPGTLSGFALELPQSKRFNRDAADLAFARASSFLKRRLS